MRAARRWSLRQLIAGGSVVAGCFVMVVSVAAQSARDAVSAHGMVVSRSPAASAVGARVLEQGGNAVDAAIATALALAVTHPSAGNIGGGGFMLIYPNDGRPPAFVDYRETAPLASTPEMFVEGGSRKTPRYVGVPGTVSGLALAHREFGSLPWDRLVQPAIDLAEQGFVLDALADELNRQVDASSNSEFRRVYGKANGSERWRRSDTLVQPDLGRTLRRIATDGAEEFYRGETAELLVQEMERGGGLIVRADLERYRAVLREPIRGTFRGYVIYSAPPPSSGGIVLTLMLNILENFDLRSMGRWSPQTNHLMVESMRRSYADRARYLGDPDFVEIPPHLTTKRHARELASSIDPRRATRSHEIGPEIAMADEGAQTTHFSVIDASGMAVANTYTLEQGYGSGIVVTGAGYLLNNEMGDFNPRPGVTSSDGLIGTPANVIAPGKRMLSSMTPTIVTRDDEVFLVTGSPGGRTIINTVLNVTLNVLEFDMSLREAIDAPRLTQQWLPDEVRFQAAEDPEFAGLVEALTTMGHLVRPGGGGDANSILVDEDGRFHGAADSTLGAAVPARDGTR